MTLLVGACLKGYAFVAGDSLDIWTYPDGTSKRDEQVKKVVQTETGLLAGCNKINVFRPVIEQLQRERTYNEENVTSLLRESRERVGRTSGGVKYLQDDRTSVFATFADRGSRLIHFHVSQNFSPGRISSVLPIPPDGAGPSDNLVQTRELERALIAAVKKNSLDAALAAFEKFFQHFRKRYPSTVGPSFQLGYHFRNELDTTDLMALD